MGTFSRRAFLASIPVLSAAGCAARRSAVNLSSVNTDIRPPAVGQFWRYSKTDPVSNLLIDTELTRVTSVGPTVELESLSENPEQSMNRSWGAPWLQPIKRGNTHAGPMPNEVQQPWGLVLVDPHWSQLQVYEKPIPLWPTILHPGWSDRINTKYRTAIDQAPLPWQLTMVAHRWEIVAVPAGRFQALRFTNLINFQSTDNFRVDSQRRETIWFAPEVGRWVARESTGIYYRGDSVDDRQQRGNSYRWNLLSWS